MKKQKTRLILLVIVVLCFSAACVLYLCDYLPAEKTALAALESDDHVTVSQTEGWTIFSPASGAETGFIFYPGGKVEHTAYAPLMRALAEQDIFCVLVEMPFNMAILDLYAAEDIPESYPQIGNWFIGGHSLGGSSAAYHILETSDPYEGLVLLASYTTLDLRDSDISVCSVYGSQDGVLNHSRYQENWSNLPKTTTEIVIEGGNHSGFGCYGLQPGDNNGEISGEKQMDITVQTLLEFFNQ